LKELFASLTYISVSVKHPLPHVLLDLKPEISILVTTARKGVVGP
jgi:hypothetical protein